MTSRFRELGDPYRPPRSAAERLADPLVRELLAARLIANLATLNADGTVHLVAMWFLWDGEAILFPTSRTTRKARNVERDGRATVMVDDSRLGLDLRGVTLAGRAELVPPPRSFELNRGIHLKYLTERGRELPAIDEYLSTDDVTIRFLPEKVSAWNLRDTPQAQALGESGETHPLGTGE